MKIRNVFLATLLAVQPAFALDFNLAQEDGGRAGAFLDYFASARSLAMGRAYAAVADDSSAIYWNPAGLSQLVRNDALAMYATLPEGAGFGFVSVGLPTPRAGTWGAGIIGLQSGNFQRRDDNGNDQGSFSNNTVAALVSNAYPLSDRWSLGGTLKAVRQNVADAADTGFGADVGVMAKLHPQWQAGLAVHNLIAPTIQLGAESDRYRRDLRLGGKFQPLSQALFSADLVQGERGSFGFALGAEWLVSELLALRGGLNDNELSAGLGVSMGTWGIDYAFGVSHVARDVQELGAAHRLGFRMSFGPAVSRQANPWAQRFRTRSYLARLRRYMDRSPSSYDQLQEAIDGGRQALKDGAYENQKDVLLVTAYIRYLEGRYAQSIEPFQKALNMEPDDAMVARHLAKAKAQAENPNAPTGTVAKKDWVDSEIARIQELERKGDTVGTLKASEAVLRVKPENVQAQAHLKKARAALSQPLMEELTLAEKKIENWQFADAVGHLKKVKTLSPSKSEASDYVGRAIELLQSGAAGPKSGGSRVVYELDRDVALGLVLYSKGLMHHARGETREAVAAWEQSLKYVPENSQAKEAIQKARVELDRKSRRQ